MSTTDFTIRPYTNKELAGHYRCSVKTFTKWVRYFQNDLGPLVGRSYSPRQVRIIIHRLGEP